MVDTGSWRATLSLNSAINADAARELLDEIDSVRTENARLGALLTEAANILRLIAREEFDDPMPGFDQCPYCYQQVHGGEFGMWIDHDADCPVERARNFPFPIATPDAQTAPATPDGLPSDVRGREGE